MNLQEVKQKLLSNKDKIKWIIEQMRTRHVYQIASEIVDQETHNLFIFVIQHISKITVLTFTDPDIQKLIRL